MKCTVILALSLLSICVAQVRGAVIHVTPTIAWILNPDFTPIDPSQIVSSDAAHAELRPRDDKYLFQVDVTVLIEDLRPPQLGFGNVAFDILLGGGLTQSLDLPEWQPDGSGPCRDDGSPCGSGVLWADNGDYGPSGNDLRSIIVGFAPRDFGTHTDPRPTFGQTPPGAYVGSVYLELDGRHAIGNLEIIGRGGSTWGSEGNLSNIGVSVVGGSVAVTSAPEPPAQLLLIFGAGACLAGYLRRRMRHT